MSRWRQLPFREFDFHGHTGERRTVSFGWRYDFSARHLRLTALSSFGLDPTAALAKVAVVYAGPKLKETGEETPEYRRGRTATTDIDEGGGIGRPTKTPPKPKPRSRGRQRP